MLYRVGTQLLEIPDDFSPYNPPHPKGIADVPPKNDETYKILLRASRVAGDQQVNWIRLIYKIFLKSHRAHI